MLLSSLLSSPCKELVPPLLSLSSLLSLTSVSQTFHSSEILLLEGRKRFPAYFLLYDAANEKETQNRLLQKISFRKLLVKASLLENREKVGILLPKDGKISNDQKRKAEEVVNQILFHEVSPELTHVVLRTFPSFVDFETLLDVIFENYRVPAYDQRDSKIDEATYKKSVQIRIVSFLRKLSMHVGEYFLYIPDKGKLLRKFLKFVDGELMQNEKLAEIAVHIKTSLIKRALLDVTMNYQIPSYPPSVPKYCNKTIHDFDVSTLAHELIMIFWEIFRNIKTPELLNLNWTKREKASLSPNLLILIPLYSRIAQWILHTICAEKKVETRGKVLKKFISIAQEASEKKGFDVSMAVYTALASSAIYRMKKTRAALSEKTQKIWTDMHTYLTSMDNYNPLRDLIKNSAPVLPAITVILTDLTFIEEAGPNLSLSVKKLELISTVLEQVELYKKVPFEFSKNMEAREYLLYQLTKTYTQEELVACDYGHTKTM